MINLPTPSIGHARDFFINSILLAAFLALDAQDEHTLLERTSSSCTAIPKSTKTATNFRCKTPLRFGSTNKFSVEMYNVLPKFPKRITNEQPHILQKSEGPLDFGFLPLFAVFGGFKKSSQTESSTPK